MRTPAAKYAVYSAWKDGTIEVDPLDQDFELYDYSSGDGEHEIANVGGPASSLETKMSQLLQNEVIPNEVPAPLPSRLSGAQQEGLDDYFARSAEPTP